MPYTPSTLDLGREPETLRHFLRGRPVKPGDELELGFERDVWVRGRYGWSFREEDPPQFAAPLSCGDAVSFAVPPRALLRWPRPAEAT